MAAYCSADDLVARFGENEMLDLAADDTGELDAALIERACDDAAGEIDGRIAAGGYSTPLASVPRIVTAYACDIARYRLYDNRATEQVTKRYEDAIRFLRGVARGEVSLGLATQDDPTSGEAVFESSPGVFSGGTF
ncbi:gp436 family protein [Chromohalobacter israelensis]|uniref:gp436 family protein n=1 Tax=Chromohalobacter israelensis TaxID=141390 RepID=UPI000FFF2454|nr:DUF1320 domain-containing protein [Chromohalobacter salexigens]RXE49211.1 hypothetical protein B4O83_15040 [Chromohalobacter salexigens]